jgi:hypothetical protein
VLTRAGVGPDFGKEHVGMAPIADDRLGQVAAVVAAAKVTPAAARIVDVPGTGPQLLGNLRRVDALLAVVDGFSAGADPEATSDRLELELLVADRDHVEQRLERVSKQAKSGDPKLRRRRAAGGDARAPRSGAFAARVGGRAAARAGAADDEAARAGRERPGGST